MKLLRYLAFPFVPIYYLVTWFRNLLYDYNIKSSKLPVKDNKTVELPNDYINYTKIGVFNNKGEVIPLKYNSKLSNFADLLPDRLQKTQDNTLFNYYSPQSGIF